MQIRNYFIAASIVVMAIVLAIVSCKKEIESTLNQKANSTQQTFDFRKIEDMNAYLVSFKTKMSESKTDTALCLDDAAWHLASLANRDFCRANVEYDNVQFDTVEMNISITDGAILLSDLNEAYAQLCTEIQQYKKSFSLSNQNLYFINVFIGANGNAQIALMTTFTSDSKGLDDHHWYFPDTFGYIDSVCFYHFGDDHHLPYAWETYGKSELERVLNLFEHHTNNPPYLIYYTPTRNFTFEHPNWQDPYGSSYVHNSRLYAVHTDSHNLSEDEMCYCLDSYLGLGYDYIVDNYLIDNEHPVAWVVTAYDSLFYLEKLTTYYHRLSVQYGELTPYGPGNPNN